MMISDTFRPFLGPDLREWGSVSPNERAALKGAFAGRLPPATINALMRRSGYRTPDALRFAEDSELLCVDGIGPASLAAIREHFPRSAVTLYDDGRQAGTCGACEAMYFVDARHDIHDCIRALLHRIKDLEDKR